MQMQLLPGTSVAMGINFLVMLAVLLKFLYNPIQKMLADRTQKISDALDNAEQARQNYQKFQAEAKKIMKDAQSEANQVIERARSEAAHLRDEMLADTRHELEELRRRHQDEMEHARLSALADLRASTVDLALLAAEKAISAKLSRGIDQHLIEQTLVAIEKGNDA
jgi:F-type H+-transporting ATPase subunit b